MSPSRNIILRGEFRGTISWDEEPVPPEPEPPDAETITVPAGSSLQAAVDSAPDGATLLLEDATYAQGMLSNTKRLTIARAATLADGRATIEAPCWIHGHEYTAIDQRGSLTLRGVGVKNDNIEGSLIDELGTDSVYDRITILGDPQSGQRRGILLHGAGTLVSKIYADHIFRIGIESSVLGGWDGTANVRIDDSYLCGGAETIMFGGSDSTAPERIPHHILITKCTLTKRPEWYAIGAQLKNAFELKCADNVVLEDCELEYAGVAEGQAAYLIVLTVRNQYGGATWSRITNVRIENCTCRYGGGGINFLGHDDVHDSGELDGVLVKNVAFRDLCPWGLWQQYSGNWGAGRGVCFSHGTKNVTLEAITMAGEGMSALGYFDNAPNQPVGLTLRNWNYAGMPTEYGWKINDGALDYPPACANLKALMPDLVYEVTDHDPGATVG